MSQQFVNIIKVCATCDYWGGRRECMQYGDYVEIDSPMDIGKCFSDGSGWRTSEGTQACSVCSYWKKWCALR